MVSVNLVYTTIISVPFSLHSPYTLVLVSLQVDTFLKAVWTDESGACLYGARLKTSKSVDEAEIKLSPLDILQQTTDKRRRISARVGQH
jgi:hypothetical protein